MPADLAPLEVEQAELGVWQRAAAHKGAALVDVLPLTPFQRGLLFRSVLAAENGRGDPAHVARDTYSLQVAAEFEGELEAGRLEGALAAVLTRHPQLAAGFRSRLTVRAKGHADRRRGSAHRRAGRQRRPDQRRIRSGLESPVAYKRLLTHHLHGGVGGAHAVQLRIYPGHHGCR